MPPLRIHAIVIALNEEDFIEENLRVLYPNCSGISVVTQYDRDYYGNIIKPDSTAQKVLSFPDPEKKIHLVVRRYNDETASRNHEMKSLLVDASKGIQSHGVPINEIRAFHKAPDYFLIVDADEIYDAATFPSIIEYLAVKKPRGMRVSAFEYGWTWNRRVPKEVYVHHHFGFIKAGILFIQRRVVSWNEMRLRSLLQKFKLNPNFASTAFGFIDCPWQVGIFHHAALVRRNKEKMIEKMNKHSHLENHDINWLEGVLNQRYEFIPTAKLPLNIQHGVWPVEFFEKI
jgi:hypothetical protein